MNTGPHRLPFRRAPAVSPVSAQFQKKKAGSATFPLPNPAFDLPAILFPFPRSARFPANVIP